VIDGLQQVASSLGEFLVEIMPPECKSKGSISLLKELCTIAFSILKGKGDDGQANFKPVFVFLTEIVNAHGEVVEMRTQEVRNGQMPMEEKGEITALLTDLLLTTVDKFYTTLMTASAPSSKQQDQGQPAFESKSLPEPKTDTPPSEEFCDMMKLFKACVERCPSYFFQLPSAPGLEGQEDMLQRKATDMAIGCLSEADPAMATHAMEFLEVLVSLVLLVNNYAIYRPFWLR